MIFGAMVCFEARRIFEKSMKPVDFFSLQTFIDEQLSLYNDNQLASLSTVTLASILNNNPYLLRSRKGGPASHLIANLITDSTSKSEEKFFNNLLKKIAVFIAKQTCGGHKSAAQGIDLEFIHHDIHYIVSIKSGPNWGNSSQHRRLAQDLRDAVTRVRQARTAHKVEPVLGICYGKTRTAYTPDGYMKVVGQSFWYLISENPDLYTDIIDPIGYRAKEHNEQFIAGRAALENKLTGQFINLFCDESGAIDWKRLVQANSMNLHLPT